MTQQIWNNSKLNVTEKIAHGVGDLSDGLRGPHFKE